MYLFIHETGSNYLVQVLELAMLSWLDPNFVSSCLHTLNNNSYLLRELTKSHGNYPNVF